MIKRVIWILAKLSVFLLFLLVCLALIATFRPKFTRHALLLAYEQQNASLRDSEMTTMIRISVEGIHWQKLTGRWNYSPDGQYATSTYSRPSHHGITVIRTDTFTTECFDIKPSGLSEPLQCDFLALYTGEWWSPTQGIVMLKPNSSITNAVDTISKSPNGHWLVTQTKPAYTVKGEWVYGTWSLIDQGKGTQFDFDLPVMQSKYCDIFNDYDWNEDSQQFAIKHGRQNYTFIWQIDHGRPQLVASIRMDTCSDNTYWSKGKFLGVWPP